MKSNRVLRGMMEFFRHHGANSMGLSPYHLSMSTLTFYIVYFEPYAPLATPFDVAFLVEVVRFFEGGDIVVLHIM